MPVLAAYMVPHPPLIVPAVGKGGEEVIRETAEAYQKVAEEIAALQPDTILITSPHSIMYRDYFHISPGKGASGSFRSFGAPEVRFTEEYDEELAGRIADIAEEQGFPAGFLGERDPSLDHGTMVPLYFIRKVWQGGRIVRIGLSGLPLTDHYILGQMIQKAVQDTGRRIVFVASGDLSHKLKEDGPYGLAEEGPVYDQRIMDSAGRGAFGEFFDFSPEFCDKAAECGHRSFVIMAGALDGIRVRARNFSHQDVTGVGYGICSFHPEGEDAGRHFLDSYLRRIRTELREKKEKADPYVRLAWLSLESYILEGRRIGLPEGLPKEMLEERAGAFVSIHKGGQLRGCIGTISPVTSSVAMEIIRNAVSASTEDPRFPAIGPEELSDLEIHVDVLGKPESIRSEEELDVRKYGVIVTAGRKKGLLLPDLEGVDTVEQQVMIARQKAGIGRNETVKLERFEVVRHE